MATQNVRLTGSFQAAEDMRTLQYFAVALNDRKLANTAEEASGILMNKPNENDHGSLAYSGELKYKAGAAVSAGDKLTVTTSGWFTTAESLDCVVGEAKVAVTSGSIGTGIFSFPAARDVKAQYTQQSATPADALLAGIAYCHRDFLPADNGEEASGVALSAVSSGVSGKVAVSGVCNAIMADTTSAGDVLTVTTSGYFSAGDSGDYICARALTNIASGVTGETLFTGIGYYLSV